MEFYGLVRDGPKNLFSRRAAKKATQEAATNEQKKNMKKSKKKNSGEKCTNHTPLLRTWGGAASWSLPAAQDTRSHAVAGLSWRVRGIGKWGWGETHRKFHSRRWRRASVFHRFRVGLSRDFIWIFAVLKDSFPTHIARDIQEVFSAFPFRSA